MKAARTLAFGLLTCGALAARANEFYIDPVAGSDSGDGSAANPWRSLEAVLDDDLIETQDWPSYPYQDGMQLVAVNAGAPVRAGDTIWLRSGYHGDLVIAHAYNTAPITIAAQPGQSPHVRSVTVQSAQNWIVRGLSISPSYAPTLDSIDMVDISDHNYFGPTWDIELGDSALFSVDDASSWGPDEWVNLASSGIYVGASRISVHDNTLRNVRFGISVDGADAGIRRNIIDGFSADGLRGLGDRDVFEYNTVENVKIGDDFDDNHDDGFQSWSVGKDGNVGTGQVTGVVLRGNLIINSTDPNDPLRNSLQGIGCFDGFFVDWTVENNVVITDHWHGISFYGMRDSRIVNNTVIDNIEGQPGPPWIMVTDHKNGDPSENVVVRNNLAEDFELSGMNVTDDHNIEYVNAAALFVAPPFDLHLIPGAAAIDAGSADLAPSVDIEGHHRPQGAGYDIGAYEVPVEAIFADGFEGP
jgi:parallel beta helix pectate lyase-like protein